MLEMSTGINNIGLAFWNYNSGNQKQFENLIINLNHKTEYFKGNKIITKKVNIFENPKNKAIHSLLFLLRKDKNIRIKKNVKKFLQRKRKKNELYDGDFSEIKDKTSKNKKIEK